MTEIPTDSKCKTEAEAIIQEMKKWAKEKDNREWNLVLKQQQDETDIQKATIKAARDIGVAYGNNQPKTITYNYRGWW